MTKLPLADEQLLQFFVTVIDAKLFEAIDVKDLEAVDVKNSDDGSVAFVNVARVDVYFVIDPRHNPTEQSLVDGLKLQWLIERTKNRIQLLVE